MSLDRYKALPRRIRESPLVTKYLSASLFHTIAALFFADRILKYLALYRFEGKSLVLIPRLLYFSLFKNPHIAFSIPFPWPRALPWIMTAILLGIGIALLRLDAKHRHLFLPLSMILAGGFSNTIDHLIEGFTIDYFHIPPISFFNIADILIGIGILQLLLQKRRGKTQPSILNHKS